MHRGHNGRYHLSAGGDSSDRHRQRTGDGISDIGNPDDADDPDAGTSQVDPALPKSKIGQEDGPTRTMIL